MEIEGYVEVYDNTTAEFLGAEVKETVTNIDYDTMWFNLNDISGINTIKVINQQNNLNMNTIYINNSQNVFVAKKVGGLSLHSMSRRYDIEMKDVYYYVYDEVEDKYTQQSIQVPMMFVQAENMNTFSSDVFEENENNGITEPVSIELNSNDLDYVQTVYSILLNTYVGIKDLITFSDVENYIGQENLFFTHLVI